MTINQKPFFDSIQRPWPWQLGLLVGLLPLLVAACQSPPSAAEVAGDPPACLQSGCHTRAAIETVVSVDAARTWVRKTTGGLTRSDPLIPSSVPAFTARFPRRGHHPAFKEGECAGCHPVSSEGARHGVAVYPTAARATAFSGGKDCAASCHGWLGAQVTVTGFMPSSGPAPTYSGSARPGHLLAAATDAHGDLYRKGFSGKAGDRIIRVGRINPGCAGCHATRNEHHGHVPGCLDCHALGGTKGKLHQAHVKLIGDHRSKIDKDNAAASSCDYCHAMSSTAPKALRNGACYNCHLSGHQPMTPAGKAHFWPI